MPVYVGEDEAFDDIDKMFAGFGEVDVLVALGLDHVTGIGASPKMFVAPDPASFQGQSVGNGHCVQYVKAATGAPPSSEWSEGQRVRGMNLPAGTAIATFQEGKYQNRVNGDSHAAIYLSQDANGITVIDQWKGHTVSPRYIPFKGGSTHPVNDGDMFSVVLA
jgi:hypothetical protein